MYVKTLKNILFVVIQKFACFITDLTHRQTSPIECVGSLTCKTCKEGVLHEECRLLGRGAV
jgi:hypothetical protein